MTRRPRPVYRRSLQDVFAENGGEAPAVFAESLNTLRQRGLQTRGLFLGHADERKVRLLERAWDQGQNPLRLAHVTDCHAVAESLLLWLRVLPAPVVPCKLFRSFLRVRHAASQTESLSQLHYLLHQLDSCELHVLEQTLGFLHDYQALQRQLGYMCPSLGHIFGHALLRPYEGPLPMAFPEDVAAAAVLLDCMIADHTVVFAHPQHASKVHKPPSKARRPHKSEPEPQWSPESAESTGSQPAEKEPGNWPGKHLRVVVVPPYEEAEVCYMDREDGLMLRGEEPNTHSLPSCRHPSERSGHFVSKLASVPEASPLGPYPPCQDLELEDLVGSLLCGSMESMLFEEDDAAFNMRTSSLLSCSAYPSGSHCESTDQSSVDDEMGEVAESPLTSPAKAHSPRLFSHNPDLQRWIAAAR